MISQADLELHLGIGAAVDAAMIVDLEASAVAWLERVTGGRHFGVSASVIDYRFGSGHAELHMAEEIGSVTSIVEQAYEGDTSAETITASGTDGYVVRGPIIVRKGGYRWEKPKEYVVTWVRGYTSGGAGPPVILTDIPDDIAQATRSLVALWYNGGVPAGVASDLKTEKIGDYSYGRGMTDDAIYESIPGLRDIVKGWLITRF